jgi:hypothetical protein
MRRGHGVDRTQRLVRPLLPDPRRGAVEIHATIAGLEPSGATSDPVVRRCCAGIANGKGTGVRPWGVEYVPPVIDPGRPASELSGPARRSGAARDGPFGFRSGRVSRWARVPARSLRAGVAPDAGGAPDDQRAGLDGAAGTPRLRSGLLRIPRVCQRSGRATDPDRRNAAYRLDDAPARPADPAPARDVDRRRAAAAAAAGAVALDAGLRRVRHAHTGDLRREPRDARDPRHGCGRVGRVLAPAAPELRERPLRVQLPRAETLRGGGAIRPHYRASRNLP